ncbi:carboxypeptidase B [Sergentomyia squamirostris]
MMKCLLVILVALIGWISATQVSYDGYQVLTLKVDDPVKLDALVQWEEQGIDFWDNINSVGHPVRVMMPPRLIDEFPAFLRDNEISYELTIPNVETVFAYERKVQNERRAYAMMGNFASRVAGNFTYYWQTPEISEYLNTLVSEYPDMVTLEEAGRSYEDREIMVLRISSTGFDGTKPIIFIDAGIHAREWIAPMSAIYLIEQLVENSAENLDLLACDWIIIPLVNPDGYQYTHDTERLWRKTRSVNPGSSCRGVDANRNYRYRWGWGTGISTNPCSNTFLGQEPHQEKEVQAVASELAKNADGVRLYLSFHSCGNWLLYPWGYDRILHDNNDELDLVGNLVASDIFAGHGVQYTVGNSAILLYPAAGASDDYAAAEHNINLSYTVELTCGGANGFDLPADQILSVATGIFTGVKAYARYVAENN